MRESNERTADLDQLFPSYVLTPLHLQCEAVRQIIGYRKQTIG